LMPRKDGIENCRFPGLCWTAVVDPDKAPTYRKVSGYVNLVAAK
jgi:hypothetical protein